MHDNNNKIWTFQFILGIVLAAIVGIFTTMYQSELVDFKGMIMNINSFYFIIIILLLILISSYLIINNQKWKPKSKVIRRLINHIWFSSMGFLIFLFLDKIFWGLIVYSTAFVFIGTQHIRILYIIIIVQTMALINLSFFCYYKMRDYKTY